MQIYHAVEGSVQMRIANPRGAFVSFGRVSTVQMYVCIGVVIIRQFAYMRLHVAVHPAFIHSSFGRNIQRHGTDLGVG